MNPRVTSVEIWIEDKDVSEYVSADLLSFSYEDKETEEADSIRFTLQDAQGKWAGRWNPEGGEKIRAVIHSEETGGKSRGSLDCGTFRIDSVRYSGAPSVVEISGVSVPLDMPIRRLQKIKAWEKTDLKKIGEEISKENGLQFMWECDEESNAEYERIEQRHESDLTFLLRLCKDNGCSVKVSAGKLIIYDKTKYEKAEPVRTIVFGESEVLSWEFSTQKGETYKAVTVQYRDAKVKKSDRAAGYILNGDIVSGGKVKKGKNPAVHEYRYTGGAADENGQVYAVKKKAANIKDAERLAKAKWKELNERSVTGNITLVGDVGVCAGVVLEVKGFGAWDGKFFVEEARHEAGSRGYVCEAKVRKCGPKAEPSVNEQ